MECHDLAADRIADLTNRVERARLHRMAERARSAPAKPVAWDPRDELRADERGRIVGHV